MQYVFDHKYFYTKYFYNYVSMSDDFLMIFSNQANTMFTMISLQIILLDITRLLKSLISYYLSIQHGENKHIYLINYNKHILDTVGDIHIHI